MIIHYPGNRLRYLGLTAGLAGGLASAGGASVWVGRPDAAWEWAVLAGGIAVGIAAAAAGMQSLGYRTVTMNESHLRCRRLFGHRAVRWDEVRRVCCDGRELARWSYFPDSFREVVVEDRSGRAVRLLLAVYDERRHLLRDLARHLGACAGPKAPIAPGR